MNCPMLRNFVLWRILNCWIMLGVCLAQSVLTWGLWAGVTSFSSCFCCCRRTRLCVWACCSWNCWAIAFSLSGYNWASKERICYFTASKKTHAHISGRAFWKQVYPVRVSPVVTWSSNIILRERSFSSCCLSSIISLLKSSVFSSSRMSGEPIPSSFSSARFLLGEEPLNSWGEKWNICFRCKLQLVIEEKRKASLHKGDILRPVWFASADCSAAIAASSPAPT